MPMMLQDLADLTQQMPPGMPPAPGTPPNGLLAQLGPLLQLGSVDQRHKLLQAQFDQGGQTAAGAPVDYSHGRGTPLALAGLANLVSAGLGGYQQGKAMAGQKQLVDQEGAGRSALAKALLGAPAPDFSSVLNASGADLAPRAAAAQDALKQQRQTGLAAMLLGDPQAAATGKSLYADADRGQETMLGMPGQRQQLAGGAQSLASGALDLASKQRGADVANSPVVGGAGAALLKKLGYPAPDGASPAEIAALVPEAQKQYAEDTKRMEVGKGTLVHDAMGNPIGVLDTRSMKVTPLSLKSPAPGGAGGAGLSKEALDQAAELYATTGAMPPVTRGKAGAAIAAAIASRAAELHPNANLAGNKAGYKADSGSLAKLQASADSIDSFETTALKNLDNFLAVAKGVSDTGIPLANKPIRAIADSLGGSPQQAKFNAARQVAVQEIGKVLGGAVAGGAISDSQRHEVEGLMRGDATLEQLTEVANVLRQDMGNRKKAISDQIAAIRGRASGTPAASEAISPSAILPAAPQRLQRKTVGGKTYEKRPDGWYEVTNGQSN